MKTFLQIAEELEKAFFALAGDKMQSYSFNGKTFTKVNITEIEALYMKYRDLAFRQTNGYKSKGRVR